MAATREGSANFEMSKTTAPERGVPGDAPPVNAGWFFCPCTAHGGWDCDAYSEYGAVFGSLRRGLLFGGGSER